MRTPGTCPGVSCFQHCCYTERVLSPDRLTVKSSEALNEALSLARRNGNPLVTTRISCA